MGNSSAHRNISLWQGLALIAFGLLLASLIIEMAIRIGGFAFLSSQESRNKISIQKKGAYRIMCLGESTTALGGDESYPAQLEEILNRNNKGIIFSVINKGVPGTNTPRILAQLEANINKYKPDMVVAMMGINDYATHIPYADGVQNKFLKKVRFLRIRNLIKMVASRIDVKKREVRKWLDYSRSERSLKKSIKLRPEDESGYVALGLFYKNHEELKKAEEVLQKVLAMNPDSEDAGLVLGWVYGSEQKFAEAETVLERVIQSNPKNAGAYSLLGWVYRSQGKNEKGEEIVKKAVELNPGSATALKELRQLYEREGKTDEFEEDMKNMIDSDPKNESAYLELGLFYESQKRFDAAEEMFKKVTAVNPRNETAYFELGWIYKNRKKFDTAEEMFGKVAALNPKNESAYLELGWLYKSQKRFDMAEEAFKKAIALNPKCDMGYVELRWIYETQKQSGMAKQMYNKAKELNPKDMVPFNEIRYVDAHGDTIREDDGFVTSNNYRELKRILDKRGIRLVCVQYPVRNAEPLREIFRDEGGVIFVDNEKIFKEALKNGRKEEYFLDMFGGDFGHCTRKGNTLLANNIAEVILKEEFNN